MRRIKRTNILAERLRRLQTAGLIEKEGARPHVHYALTPAGRALSAVLRAHLGLTFHSGYEGPVVALTPVHGFMTLGASGRGPVEIRTRGQRS